MGEGLELGGVPLNEIETLDCLCADGVVVTAVRHPGRRWGFIFMGPHPARGLRFFRARWRGALNGGPGEVQVWDVTEALQRCLARHREIASDAPESRNLRGCGGAANTTNQTAFFTPPIEVNGRHPQRRRASRQAHPWPLRSPHGALYSPCFPHFKGVHMYPYKRSTR